MGVRIGVLSTYPSTQCGIATFTESWVLAMQRAGAHVGVVRIVDEPQNQVLPVVHQWVIGSPIGAVDVARELDDYDVAVVQHEFGIFGGRDGRDVLDVVRLLDVPVVVVLHTVLTTPTPHQRTVLAELCSAASALVTMTQTAKDRLVAGWGVHPSRVSVIPHGAVVDLAPTRRRPVDSPARILTWGLLGEGKGIEWALLAMAQLGDIVPAPEYHVVGQTHPRVLERDGEAYRDHLRTMTTELDLDHQVRFDGAYLPGDELRRIVHDADVVLLPYDSREQVTSGVLAEAVAAGKPVVSTSFPHAVELLSGGAGILVPQRDPDALASALRLMLTDDRRAAHMATTSRGLAASLAWPAVAQRYLSLLGSLARHRAHSVA
jgi:glycosyltransferase involved in cell wall biosynthesis